MLFFDPFFTLIFCILDKYILVRTDNLEANMNFKNTMVVAKVHPSRASHSIPGGFYNEIELLDPHDNYKWYHTYIDDTNNNYAYWQQIFDHDYKDNIFVLEGMFRIKKNTDLINADAKFKIVEKADREDTMPLIGKAVGVL